MSDRRAVLVSAPIAVIFAAGFLVASLLLPGGVL